MTMNVGYKNISNNFIFWSYNFSFGSDIDIKEKIKEKDIFNFFLNFN